MVGKVNRMLLIGVLSFVLLKHQKSYYMLGIENEQDRIKQV